MLSSVDVETASLRRIVRNDISSNLQFDAIDEAFKDFRSAVSAILESNVNLLNEVPLHHDLHIEDLRKFMESQIRKDLSEDPLFEKGIEISKYSRNMTELMDSYFSEIFSFHQELKRELHSDIFSVSKMFLNSDLPLPFVKTLGDSFVAEIDYLEVFDKEARRERLDLIRYRSNRPKFERVCKTHNLWVKRFDEVRSKMEQERVKLIWYVDFNNSASVDDIFKDKSIKMSLMDRATLYGFIRGLQKQVSEMETLNAQKTEIISFLDYETDEGTEALLGMMQILGRYEGMQ